MFGVVATQILANSQTCEHIMIIYITEASQVNGGQLTTDVIGELATIEGKVLDDDVRIVHVGQGVKEIWATTL